MGFVVSPRQLAVVLGRPLALLLAATGIAAVAYECFVGHPEAVRFSREGRSLTGEASPYLAPNRLSGEHFASNGSRIAVDDPELGSQVVEVYGHLPKGQRVPVLCLTPLRRCMSADVVKERLALWPLTPVMLTGGVELALAALLLAAGRRRRRRAGAQARQPAELASHIAEDERQWKQLAIERALAAFRAARPTPPTGAHVLRLGRDEAIVRVMYMTDHIPPDRAWFAVRRDSADVRELSYADVAAIETPWR